MVSVEQFNEYTQTTLYYTLKAGELHGMCIILNKMLSMEQ